MRPEPNDIMKPVILALACLFPAGNLSAEGSVDTREVLVTVNGSAIREEQFRTEVDRRIDVYAAKSAAKGLPYEESSREQTRQAMREEVIHALIERELISQQLTADHLEITEPEIDAWLAAKYKERGLTPQQAEQEMIEQGKTLASVRERIKWSNIAIQKLYALHAPDQRELTESEAKVIYASEIKSFKQEHERRVSRILIEASRDHDEAFRKAAKKKAEVILARIRKGEDFSELAKSCSEDRITAAKGGDRGWSPRGFVSAPGNDPFGDVAFAMKKIGEVSEVVETLDGYEIIKLTGLKEEKQKSFEEVKADIIGRRHYLMVGKFWDQFFAGMQSKAEIVWSPAELARKGEREKAEREASLNAERSRLLGGDISGR